MAKRQEQNVRDRGVEFMSRNKTAIVTIVLAAGIIAGASAQQRNPPPHNVVILVRDHQMEPDRVTAPAGPVQIVVHNQTTANRLQFSLAMEKGNQLRRVDVPAA